jgi:hypothetical protein
MRGDIILVGEEHEKAAGLIIGTRPPHRAVGAPTPDNMGRHQPREDPPWQ